MKNKKKLLIVYYSMGIGGIEKRIRDFVSEISKTYPEWEIYFFLKDQNSSYFLDQLKARKVRFICHSYPFLGKPFVSIGFICWYIWNYFCIAPDVILTFDTNLSYAVIFLTKVLFFWKKTKVFINTSVVISRYIVLTKARFSSRILPYIYPFADAIIAPTQIVKNDLIKKYGIFPKKIFVIPTWTLFIPFVSKKNLQYDIAYIGRYSFEKNPFGFLEVVNLVKKQIPTIHAVMVGEGLLYRELQQFVDIHGLHKNVTFLPFQHDVESIFHDIKLLIVPSLNEGLPNVILEAGMCSVPSIISSFPGAHEAVIHKKTGYIATSIKKLYDYTLYLLQHESTRIAMGKNAQKRVKTYNSYVIQKKYIDLLLS